VRQGRKGRRVTARAEQGVSRGWGRPGERREGGRRGGNPALHPEQSYADRETAYRRGSIPAQDWDAYRAAWAFAGTWWQGRFCFYHVSDVAEALRAEVHHRRQLDLDL